MVDAYTHILLRKYQNSIDKKVSGRNQYLNTARYSKTVTTLLDLDARFRIMDDFEDYIQVISIASPPIYEIVPPDIAREALYRDNALKLLHLPLGSILCRELRQT